MLLAGRKRAGSSEHAMLDCTKLAESPACDSFRSRFAKGNSTVIGAVSPPNQAVVCFRPGEDTFLVVSYPRVEDQAFPPGLESPDLEKSLATVTTMVYKNQQSDDLRRWPGYWEKLAREPKTEAVFTSAGGDQGIARIDSSGLVISYDFVNAETTTITLYASGP